jgi:hypothetical protein
MNYSQKLDKAVVPMGILYPELDLWHKHLPKEFFQSQNDSASWNPDAPR